MLSFRHIASSITAAAVGVATAAVIAASPASAAPAFHTTFTLSSIGDSGISGIVVDTHELGVPTFENETWSIHGATPGDTYFPVITIGGCAIDTPTGFPSTPLPIAVLGYPTTANAAGNASTRLKVSRDGLNLYLATLGIDPSNLPAQVPAQLLLVPAFPGATPFQDTGLMVSQAVAATDCQLVSTS